ncbi:hypothetical protein B7463_g9813, partial [Scytalidium lignicola]
MDFLEKARHKAEDVVSQGTQAQYRNNPFFSSPPPPPPRPAAVTQPTTDSIFDVYADSGPETSSKSVFDVYADSSVDVTSRSGFDDVGTSTSSQDSKCTGEEARLTKYTQFYVHKNSVDFSICNYCYGSKILPYPSLCRQFEPYRATSDEDSTVCVFFLPRVLIMWQSECLPNDTLQPLLHYFQAAAHYEACDGPTTIKSGPYYEPLNGTIPGLAICPTCFEQFLHKTPFEFKFRMNLGNTTSSRWVCDMSQPFFRRVVKRLLEDEHPSFNDFAREANIRMSTPSCPGKDKPTTEFAKQFPGIMFATLDGGRGGVCKACYLDYVSNTPLQSVFGPIQLPSEHAGKLPCDLSSRISKAAMQFAIRRGDVQIWRKTVLAAERLTPCNGNHGVSTEELAGEKERVGELANCTSTKNSENFETSLSWRGRLLLNAIIPGVQAGNWSRLLEVAKGIAMEPPPCAGGNRGFTKDSGRRWLGRAAEDTADSNDCTIVFCEDCHARIIKGTRYAYHYSKDLTEAAYIARGDAGVFCPTYTKRTRALLREASETGQLAKFAQIWNYRTQLGKKRDSWIPILQNQMFQQQIAMMQTNQQSMLKGSAMMTALHMKGAASATETLMGFQGTQYGNSIIGFDHWTRSSANADMAWHNASNMQVGIGLADPSLMSNTNETLMQALRDEEAFKAVE